MKETFLQFGTGNFLRAFVDLFVSQENRAGRNAGKVVGVQSTTADRGPEINERGGSYHVVIRGIKEGKVVDDVEVADAISRVLIAATEWDGILKVAASPDLKWIFSNVTEAGLVLDEKDLPTDKIPFSYPAKLLQCLRARYQAGGGGITVLACELVPDNGRLVRKLILDLAARWGCEPPFIAWLEKDCRWVSTLVDRIVPGKPLSHPLLDSDPLLLSTEPFALWALEGKAEELPLNGHPSVVATSDISRYALRKVRILNGAHTALVAKAVPMGITEVREAVEHPEVGPWLKRLLFEEIVPVLEGRVEEPELFARQTLERFANPFLDHKLAEIAKGHEGKMALRLQPTLIEFRERFGREPEILASLFQ